MTGETNLRCKIDIEWLLIAELLAKISLPKPRDRNDKLCVKKLCDSAPYSYRDCEIKKINIKTAQRKKLCALVPSWQKQKK